MKQLLAIASLALFVTIGGCVSAGTFREIAYEQVDLPDLSAIEMRYQNQSNIRMCFAPGQWPSPSGGIPDAEKTAFLVVGSQRFAMRHFDGGYCVGNKCYTVVKPGQYLVTRIPYEFFDLPGELSQQPKHLGFTVWASPCGPS